MDSPFIIHIKDINNNILDELVLTHLLFDGSYGYDMRVPDEKVLDMLNKKTLTLCITRNRLTASFVITNLQLLTTTYTQIEYQTCYFEINKEMASFFEKIVAKYRATKPDKKFNIIPPVNIGGKPYVNINIYRAHFFYNDDEIDKTKSHNLLASHLASYLTYDVHFDILFKNNYKSNNKSNYIPIFNPYGIRLNINKSIVEQEAIKLSKQQMRLYSKLIFSKLLLPSGETLVLPDEILDHIASFLATHNSTKIFEIINTQILSLIL